MRTGKKRRANVNRKGTLMLIATLLVGSAVLRLSLHAGAVLAEDGTPEMASDEQTTASQSMMSDAQLEQLLQTLKAREAALEQRESEMAMRDKTLEIAAREVKAQIEELEATEVRLRATMARADTAAEDDLTQLTTLYENMKPKDAAALFEEMDPVFAAGFLGRMRADAAASIMAGLAPQTAYSISVIMAGRNANAPTE